MAEHYWVETLGCPKNQVDSDKLVGTLVGDGFEAAAAPGDADLVVVNTCAFIEAARTESIDTVLALADLRRPGARLVVTGCMAERYRDELAAALPEVDLVAGFGVSLTGTTQPPATATATATPATATLGTAMPAGAIAPTPTATPVSLTAKPLRGSGSASGADAQVPSFDLLNLPRPPATAPWAYVKVAEGCDRNCGFCAIPSFRGKQRSRTAGSIVAEIGQLGSGASPLREVVLVAQDLASFGRDRSTGSVPGSPDAVPGAIDAPVGEGRRPLVDLVHRVADLVRWTRLLYLYPSSLDDALVDTILATGVPYFDLSLQHVSRPLLKRMRRWGEGDRFLDRIAAIRRDEPGAAFRSSFIVGYPGETEEDHDQLLAWLGEAQLDWVGFFPFSSEEGTHAAGLDGQVPPELVAERLRECTELQDAVTAARRDLLIGTRVEVLVDAPGEGRTYREAPEIDGIVSLPTDLAVGTFVDVVVTGAAGPDLVAEPVGPDGSLSVPPAVSPDGIPVGALR